MRSAATMIALLLALNAVAQEKPPCRMGMQTMQEMKAGHPSSQASAADSMQAGRSTTHDTKHLQEPENPAHKTGRNLATPELLSDVALRPAKSLTDFLNLAKHSNPTITQAKELVRKSEAQTRQAGLYPNPTAGYQGEQIRGGDYGGGEQGGFVQQTIILGGKLNLRREIYRQQTVSDSIGVDEQTLRVYGDVQQAFYATLAAQALVDVRRRLLGVTLDAVETVHQLANVGQADAPDILQTEVESEQATVDYVAAQREFLAGFRTLAAVTGVPHLPPCPLDGDLLTTPSIKVEEQIAQLIAESPEVHRAQQEVIVAEARLKATRREPVPDLYLQVGGQYNGELVSESPNRATGFQSLASASIDLPLWNRNQGNIAAAKAEVERAQQDVTRMQLQLQQEAEPLAQAYETARFESDRYETELIPRAQRAYELYLAKYQAMAQAYPQVIVSQRTLFQLQVGYLLALRETWRNALALKNFTLAGGLNAPQASGSSTTSINPPSLGGSQE